MKATGAGNKARGVGGGAGDFWGFLCCCGSERFLVFSFKNFLHHFSLISYSNLFTTSILFLEQVFQ